MLHFAYYPLLRLLGRFYFLDRGVDRAEIERLTNEFLARDGQIQKIEQGKTTEPVYLGMARATRRRALSDYWWRRHGKIRDQDWYAAGGVASTYEPPMGTVAVDVFMGTYSEC